jgi:LacI family transcriptional regulator
MSPTRRRPARLNDVADAAGVHFSTVSRVLNGNTDVSIRPETRERILDVARQLRYRPNALARGLKLASTGALGMLVPSLRNPVLSAIIRGAFERAWERDFVVVLAEDTSETAGQAAYERLVNEGRIDGLLVTSARPGSPLLERFLEHHVPTVFVNRRHPGSRRNVSMREEDAGRLAAEHLLELGHRRLAHLAGLSDLDTARRRKEGFAAATVAAGAQVEVAHAPFEERGGYEGMRALLATDPRPTGVFVSNINQAVGSLAGARAAGFAAPADLSVVTYDDDPVAEFLEPPLSVIRMPLFELGVRSVDALLAQLEGEPPSDVVVETPPELVRRASTAPPPA